MYICRLCFCEKSNAIFLEIFAPNIEIGFSKTFVDKRDRNEVSSYRVNLHWLAGRRELTQVRSNEDDNDRLGCERQRLHERLKIC